MSWMLEVYYKPPANPEREASLKALMAEVGGWLDSRECPLDGHSASVCLTFEFDDRRQAEIAAARLTAMGEHVEGPYDYS
jgi:hypothetical protein